MPRTIHFFVSATSNEEEKFSRPRETSVRKLCSEVAREDNPRTHFADVKFSVVVAVVVLFRFYFANSILHFYIGDAARIEEIARRSSDSLFSRIRASWENKGRYSSLSPSRISESTAPKRGFSSGFPIASLSLSLARATCVAMGLSGRSAARSARNSRTGAVEPGNGRFRAAATPGVDLVPKLGDARERSVYALVRLNLPLTLPSSFEVLCSSGARPSLRS